MRWNYDTLTDCLKRAGLQRTDNVIIHSSASAVGDTEGGNETILKVFMDYFGQEGLCVFPAMTYTLIHPWSADSARCKKCKVPQKYCFAYGLSLRDKRTFRPDMPCCTGALPNLFLKQRGVVRSLSVSSSVAAYGPDAEDFVSGHEQCESGCALHSPWYKMMERKGKILMIGCPINNMTFLHGVCEWAGRPETYSGDFVMPIEIRNSSGEKVESRERRPVSGYSASFGIFEKPFREGGALQDLQFGNAKSLLGDCTEMFKIGSRILRKN